MCILKQLFFPSCFIWRMRIILYVIFFLPAAKSMAQNADLGSWNIVNIKYTVNQKWSMFGEAQLRSLRFYNNFHYYEYKGGVNFRFHKDALVALGMGSYQTYREGGNFVLPKNNDELRIWPMLNLSQSLGAIKIEQRYRAEFRFTSSGYRNRFRYRLGVSHAFGKETKGYKPFQVTASNEIFFTDREPYFERNRMLLAINYKPTNAIMFHTGYLHQFDYKINDETGRDFLVLGVYLELFRKARLATPKDVLIMDD